MIASQGEESGPPGRYGRYPSQFREVTTSENGVNLLWDFLAEAAAERGAEPFLTDLRTSATLSYAELLKRSAAAAAGLAARGVKAGDRVAYVTRNNPAFFPLLFGCAHVGAALVPLNEDSAPAETASVLGDCGPVLVLADQAADPAWTALAESFFERAPAGGAVNGPAERDAIVIYTSGTTGQSKGVVLSQKNLVSMARTLATTYGYRPGQRFLSMLPNYHINAPSVTGMAIIAGRSHVLVTDPYGFTNARLILSFAEEHRINVLSLTPSIMASLLKMNPEGTPANLSSVAFGLVGTAHLAEPLWRRFEETFGFPCYQGYGLTETTTWATMTPPDGRKRYDSAGLPIGCEVSIDAEAGGEVLIRGSIVMNGYFNRPAVTKKQFKDDWFRTGDIGRIDPDGQLVITGRIKNIIKRRGILISPEEIDQVVRRFPGVTDACTVGVPDEVAGEKILTACVVDPAQLEALSAHVRRELSAYKVPDKFIVVGEIPKTPMGKQDLKELRRILTGEKAAEIVRGFDVYKFRRARTEDLPVIQEKIQRALVSGGTVDFVGFWGVGSRAATATPDVVALERLKMFLDAIDASAGRPLATMTLILADVHARCNEVPAAVYEPYFEAVRQLAAGKGFRATWLSQVWKDHQLDFGNTLQRMAGAEALEEWEAFPLRDDFRQQARRRTDMADRVEDFAYRYFLTITTENPAVAASFPGHVFFTYNGPEFRPALPQMPMVHLHSVKPGTAAKPWFLDA